MCFRQDIASGHAVAASKRPGSPTLFTQVVLSSSLAFRLVQFLVTRLANLDAFEPCGGEAVFNPVAHYCLAGPVAALPSLPLKGHKF
jgi:hypothetical protein